MTTTGKATTMTTPTPDPYPEHTKQRPIIAQSQAIDGFLEWVAAEKGLVLARRDTQGRYMPDHYSPTELLAEFFEIDLTVIEQERRAMLDAARAAQDRNPA